MLANTKWSGWRQGITAIPVRFRNDIATRTLRRMSHPHNTDEPTHPNGRRRPIANARDPTRTPHLRPAKTPGGPVDAETTVRKVCAYVTRKCEEMLVFDGPGHERPQVPKGTIDGDEPPRVALRRELREETGLEPGRSPTHVASDVWVRRHHPPRRYLRHFYHVRIEESRDAWTHVVTGSGEEVGAEFAFTWRPIDDVGTLALDLDDYVPLVRDRV
jgi:putative (di)nucleoside polyphosphate hydrolase